MSKIACHAEPGQVLQQRLADSLAAKFRSDIEIFQIDAMPAAKRRIIVEPEHKSRRFSIPFRNLGKDARIVAKQVANKILLGRHDLVQEFFVIRQRTDELKNESGIVAARRPDQQSHLTPHVPFGRASLPVKRQPPP